MIGNNVQFIAMPTFTCRIKLDENYAFEWVISHASRYLGEKSSDSW